MKQLMAWIKLGFGFILIFIFIKIMTWLLFSTPAGKELKTYIVEENIDCTPLFYTESEEAGKADYLMRKNKEWTKIAK